MRTIRRNSFAIRGSLFSPTAKSNSHSQQITENMLRIETYRLLSPSIGSITKLEASKGTDLLSKPPGLSLSRIVTS